jgi:hypothetical protein
LVLLGCSPVLLRILSPIAPVPPSSSTHRTKASPAMGTATPFPVSSHQPSGR